MTALVIISGPYFLFKRRILARGKFSFIHETFLQQIFDFQFCYRQLLLEFCTILNELNCRKSFLHKVLLRFPMLLFLLVTDSFLLLGAKILQRNQEPDLYKKFTIKMKLCICIKMRAQLYKDDLYRKSCMKIDVCCGFGFRKSLLMISTTLFYLKK